MPLISAYSVNIPLKLIINVLFSQKLQSLATKTRVVVQRGTHFIPIGLMLPRLSLSLSHTHLTYKQRIKLLNILIMEKELAGDKC